MFTRARQFFRYITGTRTVSVERETPALLELRYGAVRTVFDRAEQKITQNGRLVGILPLVENIELHRPRNQEGMVNWFVTVHLRGSRQVEVGQLTDETDASIIGAHIASITGCPVNVGDR
jgi:hypothetical protein